MKVNIIKPDQAMLNISQIMISVFPTI
jgi:hypothetical protein